MPLVQEKCISEAVDVSLVERHNGLTTSHLHIQLDPSASKLTISSKNINYGAWE